MTIKWIGAHANNFEKGRQGYTVKKIVIHWIVGKLAAADATFQDPNRIASAHYGIGNTVVHQYVKEEDTAYHAGNLTVNRQSIGIEHEGGPDLPISEETYKTSAELVADICRRYAIPVDRTHIIRHGEVKATQCPGTYDMDRLIRDVTQILAPAPDTIPVKKDDFEKLVTNSRERDNIRNYLSVPLNPLDALATKVKEAIDGLRNVATGLQRQLSEAVQEIKNRTEQVDRIKQTYEASAKTDKERIEALEKAQIAWQEERGVLQGQVEQFAKDKGAALNEAAQWKTKYEQAIKGMASVMGSKELFYYWIISLFPKKT